jgi:chemotaxis protein histidine kinase CheA
MKSTKLLTVLFLLFITSTLFAQKVHYKDSYYTIVKSKIFHRGHDVFGRLTAGKIDTIYMISKELYDERGKLKEQYKNTKKRDRYKLPEGFWEQKNIASIEATNTIEKKATETNTPLEETENQKAEIIEAESNASTTNTAPKIIEEKATNTTKEKKEKVVESEKTATETEDIKPEKEENSVREEEEKVVVKEKNKQPKEEEKQKVAKGENEYKKATKKAKNSDSNETKKSIEKIENKQSQEAKKLEKKSNDLKKEKNIQSKKQKSLRVQEMALVSTSIVNTSISNKDTFGTIYIKVNKEKTNTTKSGGILLFFDVINNSNTDLVILKPNNSMDNRLDFFSNTMECMDIPILTTDYIAKDLKIKDEDYLTIPANAKIELFVNGKYHNWLACNSEDIILQIQYNPFKNAEEDNELQPAFKKELNKSLKKITPLKIESENIKFKLNKQE